MNTTTLIIVSVLAALGMVGVVTIGVVTTTPQAAAAGCENGPGVSIAVNASKGRRFGH